MSRMLGSLWPTLTSKPPPAGEAADPAHAQQKETITPPTALRDFITCPLATRSTAKWAQTWFTELSEAHALSQGSTVHQIRTQHVFIESHWYASLSVCVYSVAGSPVALRHSAERFVRALPRNSPVRSSPSTRHWLNQRSTSPDFLQSVQHPPGSTASPLQGSPPGRLLAAVSSV